MAQRHNVDLVKLSVNEAQVHDMATRFEVAAPEPKVEVFWPQKFVTYGPITNSGLKRLEPTHIVSSIRHESAGDGARTAARLAT